MFSLLRSFILKENKIKMLVELKSVFGVSCKVYKS